MENITCVHFKLTETEVGGSLCYKVQMHSDLDYYKYPGVFAGCRFKNSQIMLARVWKLGTCNDVNPFQSQLNLHS